MYNFFYYENGHPKSTKGSQVDVATIEIPSNSFVFAATYNDIPCLITGVSPLTDLEKLSIATERFIDLDSMPLSGSRREIAVADISHQTLVIGDVDLEAYYNL